MLPKDSTHVFKYPTLYFTFSLSALESGSCDLGWNGRLFRWNGSSSGASGNKSKKAITALQASDYLSLSHSPSSDNQPSQPSWSAKLQAELHHRGYLSEVQDLQRDFETWVVTMPSFLGLHGINPLTVYFVYRRDSEGIRDRGRDRKKRLWLCLLEVHNTFSERHLYLLPIGIGEDRVVSDCEGEGEGGGKGSESPSTTDWEDLGDDEGARPTSSGDGLSWPVSSRRQGYNYQWTFPRSFHVSPFNDRSGYYRLYLKDLWQDGEGCSLPTMDIRLLLLTPTPVAEPAEQHLTHPHPHLYPQLEKKLLATLSSHPHNSTQQPRPLTSPNLVKALIKQPFDLTLTFARIAYQAAKLHYGKRLDVFGKPDLSVATRQQQQQQRGEHAKGQSTRGATATAFDGIGWPTSTNATQIELQQQQPERTGSSQDSFSPSHSHSPLPRNGSLYWSQPSAAQAYFREWFLEIAQQSPRISVKLVYSNGQVDHVASQKQSSNADATLVIYLLSHAFFADLALYGSPSLAFLMGSRVGRRWGINDLTLWDEFFTQLPRVTSEPQMRTQWIESLRTRHFNWAQSFVAKDNVVPIAESDTGTLDSIPSTRIATWTFYIHLASLHYAAVIEYTLFKWVRARYVQGDEPWLEWSRAVELTLVERGEQR